MEGPWKKREFISFRNGQWLEKREDEVAGNKSRGLREIHQNGLLTDKDQLSPGESLEKMGHRAVFSKGPRDK